MSSLPVGPCAFRDLLVPRGYGVAMRRHRVALSLAASIVVIAAAVVAVAMFVSSLDPKMCTLLASEPTIKVDLQSVDPGEVRSGVVKVCDSKECASGELVLRGRTDRLVSARVQGMSGNTSEVTVTLETASGTLISSTSLRPRMLYPNGRGCGGESPQASVVWTKSGLADAD